MYQGHRKALLTVNYTMRAWPVGQAVKTPASHAGNRGSSPLRVTNLIKPEVVRMKKTILKRLAIVIPVILITMFLISACDSPDPRIAAAHYFSAGGQFQTNVTVLDKDGNPDPRRQIRCTIVFEVVDEQAVAELEEVTFKVRNSVLAVLGELTLEEITVNRDLDAISQRLVDRINEDLPTTYELFLRAFFTDFALV